MCIALYPAISRRRLADIPAGARHKVTRKARWIPITLQSPLWLLYVGFIGFRVIEDFGIWGFPNIIKGTCFGVPISRIIVLIRAYVGALYLGKLPFDVLISPYLC